MKTLAAIFIGLALAVGALAQSTNKISTFPVHTNWQGADDILVNGYQSPGVYVTRRAPFTNLLTQLGTNVALLTNAANYAATNAGVLTATAAYGATNAGLLAATAAYAATNAGVLDATAANAALDAGVLAATATYAATDSGVLDSTATNALAKAATNVTLLDATAAYAGTNAGVLTATAAYGATNTGLLDATATYGATNAGLLAAAGQYVSTNGPVITNIANAVGPLLITNGRLCYIDFDGGALRPNTNTTDARYKTATATNYNGWHVSNDYWLFTDGETNSVSFDVALGETWNLITNQVWIKLFWTIISTNTVAANSNVVWEIQPSLCDPADTASLIWMFGGKVYVTNGCRDWPHTPNVTPWIGPFNMGGVEPTTNSFIQFVISRTGANTSDTLTNRAALKKVLFRYRESTTTPIE